MPRPRKLSPNLEREVLERYARGVRTKDLIPWLHGEHGIEISAQALNKFLRETREERSAVAQAVVREAMAEHVTSDIDIIGKELRKAVALSDRLHARVHVAFDARDEVDAALAAGQKADPDTVLTAMNNALELAELALKACARATTIADRKLHYAGADGDGGPSASHTVMLPPERTDE